jgi:hypothetical protein
MFVVVYYQKPVHHFTSRKAPYGNARGKAPLDALSAAALSMRVSQDLSGAGLALAEK